ncbi:hypothetical protein CSW98_12020 [Vibrio sp. HA2012]|uniref:autotransporter assembly complex protein TamA n=1 Tax=Vibrio sp. HA2012 TaxID=1971595 RepID=UPI000C2C0F03|nr:autotransporter assembly complex family protein [Vibrio sp. HA2012]PJC85779.1 hypothetical protein CSW98_12020 [Vibrio sp. HA2012]
MIKRRLLFCLSTILFTSAVRAEVSLTINGLEGELQDNVDAYLSAFSPEEYSTSLRFRYRLEKRIKQALRALGYYHPDILFRAEGEHLLLTVTPGSPVIIEQSDIVLEGEISSDPDANALISHSGLQKEAVVNHGNYQALKSGLRNLALAKGYFDGHFTRSELAVAPDLNQAFIHLHYSSGDRYHLGATRIEGSQIEESKVRSLIPYREGDVYRAATIARLSHNLSDSGWFSSVAVEPMLDSTDKNGHLPMKVTLVPAAGNQLETGIGYSTDVGPRASLNWDKPWVNLYGHSFESSLSFSEPEQTATLGYKIPLEDVLNEYYRIELGIKNLDDNDTQSLESSLKLERHWQLTSGWQRNASVRYLYEDYEQASEEDELQMLLPGIAYSRTRIFAKDGVLPMRGNKQSVSAEIADENLISPTRLLRLQGQASWVESIGPDHRAFVRLTAGANLVDNIEDIPPSLRFFAGGDSSLRGYDYESISPRDEDGELIGARYMATGTLEYQYRLTGSWWLAGFIDAGDAWSDSVPEWKQGIGAGVRWISPVGPVRLDFAWGQDTLSDDSFRIHFTLGAEL